MTEPKRRTEAYCATCNNTGMVDCHCGGDLCVCGADEIECPECHGMEYDPFADDDDPTCSHGQPLHQDCYACGR